MRTDDKKINDLLTDKVFGGFHWEKDYGIFLRQFDDPDDWPLSYLVYIDKSDKGFTIAGVPCFSDTFVQGGSAVPRMKFSAKTPHHHTHTEPLATLNIFEG